MTTTVPVTDILTSAIAAGDWLLSCLRVRRKQRFDEIFDHLYLPFKENRVDSEAFQLFLSTLPDVFDSLTEALREGSITVETGGNTGSAAVDDATKINKMYSDLITDADDFLMFLLVFAKALDATESEQQHVLEVIRILGDVEKPASSDPDAIAATFPELRLKAMMAGFNALPTMSLSRYTACMNIIEFSSKFNLFGKLVPYIDSMEHWALSHNQVTSEERRKFFTLLCREIQATGQPKLTHQLLQCTLKLLRELEGTPADELEKFTTEVEQTAINLLKLAISTTDVVTYDKIISSRVVQSLKGTENESLYDLARIFYTGDQNDFETYAANNSDVFMKYDLDKIKCREKINLLVLASMASELPAAASISHHMSLPLREIAEKLNLSLKEAESLAVKAIGLGIIDGRIDQSSGIVAVRSGLSRTFGKDQWQQLHTRLSDLQRNVKEVLGILDKHQENLAGKKC